MNCVFLDFHDVAVICVVMLFFFFPGREKAHLTFLMVYKLVNGIFNSAHRLPASVNTRMDETIRVDQIFKS